MLLLYRSVLTGSSVVISATLASGSVAENKIVPMDQIKKKAVSNAAFLNQSRLLNIVISVL